MSLTSKTNTQKYLSDKDRSLTSNINTLFTSLLLTNLESTTLSNEEKEARRVLLSNLMYEVNLLLSEEKERQSELVTKAFKLANEISHLRL